MKSQISLHPSYLKIDMMCQSKNVESVFDCKTLHFIHKFQNTLGKCYIRLKVYKRRKAVTQESKKELGLYHLSYQINPEKTKTKQYRLILNSYDLQNFFDTKIDTDSPFDFIGISRELLSKFQVWRTLNTKVLYIPAPKKSSLDQHSDQMDQLYLQNDFNVNTFDNKMKINNYLEHKNYQPRVIYQGVKRIEGEFFVITIEHVNQFDFWSIKVYHPKTSRYYESIIFFDDILNLRKKFL
mmetsp:Transcript_28234/g.25036  ORF Transcript_28234/g.25036 Transcript_28234/m.25036 type:complete len:239 (+) Transcript_28234:224-940(+)